MKKKRLLALTLSLLSFAVLTFAVTLSASAVTDSSFSAESGLNLTLGKDYDYSFAVVGDTQCLNYYCDYKTGTENMKVLYNWIINNSEAKNIKYVMGLGDITQSFNSSQDGYDWEWAHAKEAIELLGDAGIPYSLVRGNHDITGGLNAAFGKGSDYYASLEALEAEGKAGIYCEGKIENTWRKVEIGLDKYIIFTFDWAPDEGAMYWAEQVINANPDYKIIATIHQFLAKDGSISDDPDTTLPHENVDSPTWGEAPSGGFVYPRTLWEEVLSKYSNVEMILCGHEDIDDIKLTQLKGDNGNTVSAVLIDPQGMDNDLASSGGLGMVAMFYFKENGEVVNVEYISTVRAAANKSAYLNGNQFSFKTEYENGWTKTDYGYIPTEKFEDKDNIFHLFLDDDGNDKTDSVYLGSYDRWVNDDKTGGAKYAASKIYNYGGVTVRRTKTISILMTDNYDGSNDGKYNTEGDIPGTLTLDLGGNSFISGGTSPIFYVYNRCSDRSPTFNLKNGTVYMMGTNAVLALQSSAVAGNGSTYNLNVEGVKFKYPDEKTLGSSVNPLLTTYGGSKQAEASVNVTFTDCEIDLSHNLKDGVNPTMFVLFDANDNNHAKVTVAGGTIIVPSLSRVGVYSENSGKDSFAFAKNSSGEYTSFVLASDDEAGKIFPAENGSNIKLSNPQATDSAFTYTLSETNEGDGKFVVSGDALFVAFNNDGTKAGTHPTWDAAVCTNNVKGNRILYMTKNYEVEKRKSLGTFAGTLTIDLGGHTLTVNDGKGTDGKTLGLFSSYFGAGNSANLHITIRNGKIVNNNKTTGLIQINYSAENTDVKTVNFTFENVEFSAGEGAKTAIIYPDENAYATTTAKGTTTVATFNDCIFNYSSGVMFNLGSGSTKYKSVFNVVVNGGTFVSENALTEANICSRNTVSTHTDTFKLGMYNGEYPSFKIKSGNAAPGAVFTSVFGSALSYEKISDDGTYAVYQLGAAVSTKYGDIPFNYADAEKYPFVIFKNGAFVGADDVWCESSSINGAISTAVSKASSVDDKVTVLMRRDVVHTAGITYNNLYTLKGTLTIDLGGYTLNSNREILQFNQKKNSTDIRVNIESGSIIMNQRRLLAFATQDASVSQKAYLTFTNVYLGHEYIENQVHYSGIIATNASKGSETGYCSADVVFNNCTVDTRNVKLSSGTSYTIFDLSSDVSPHEIHAVFNGGNIILTPDYNVKLASLKSGYGEDGTGADSLKFSDDYGRYTKIIAPDGKTLPALTSYSTDNNLSVSSVLWSRNDELGTTTYILREKSISEFKPKSSITLGSELVYNVYVPKTSALISFTLGGISYTDLEALNDKVVVLEDGNEYYLMKLDLPASRALESFALIAKVKSGNEIFTGRWTLGIVKYSERVLGECSIEEAQLIRDVLSYLRAAYAYFDKTDAEQIAKINALLGENYDAENAPVMNGSEIAPTEGLKGATFVLNATPAIRFYLADGADSSKYTFYVDGNKLDFIEGSDSNGAYAQISVFAYLMGKTIEYRIDETASGSYHINSYYEFAKTQNNEKLVTLVERFAKYCESADEYRRAVIGAEN